MTNGAPSMHGRQRGNFSVVYHAAMVQLVRTWRCPALERATKSFSIDTSTFGSFSFAVPESVVEIDVSISWEITLL